MVKINIKAGPNAPGGGVLDPGDDFPPLDINKLFELTQLRASRTSFTPFEEVEIEWAISIKDPAARFSDYAFSLVETSGVLVENLEPTGSFTLKPHKNTLLRVRARRLGGTPPTTLGQGMALTVDETDCQSLELLLQSVVDYVVFERFDQLTSDSADIRLRGNSEPVSTWTAGLIRYDFPMEIVINNFFNADLDVALEIRVSVEHDGSDSVLDITVSHSSDVDFDTWEDIASIGSTVKLANGIEKFLPLVFDCQSREMERQLARAIVGVAQPALNEGKRLLAVRIVPLGNFSHIAVVVCPPPSEPESGDGPVAPPDGGVVIDG